MGCHPLLQGIFPTQGRNLGLLHCRQILYRLSYQGSPICVYICVYLFVHLCLYLCMYLCVSACVSVYVRSWEGGWGPGQVQWDHIAMSSICQNPENMAQQRTWRRLDGVRVSDRGLMMERSGTPTRGLWPLLSPLTVVIKHPSCRTFWFGGLF